ncbi:MAG: hypothetical protein PVG07_04070 [Acidobacteriota bacterium]
MVQRRAVGPTVSVLLFILLLPLLPSLFPSVLPPLLPEAQARSRVPAVLETDLVPETVFGPLVLPGVSRVVLLATNSLQVERDSRILSGDLVVNDASPGPTLPLGVELEIESGVTTAAGDSVRADGVRIDRAAVVAGDVVSNELENKGTILGSILSPLALPVFGELPPFQEAQPRFGALPVIVPDGGDLVLEPGAYDAVQVGQGAVLTLTGGTYHVASVTTGAGSSVLFEAPAEVRVFGRVAFGRESLIAPAEGVALGGSEMVFHVGGFNGADGLLGSLPPAAQVDKDSVLVANVYAPMGTLILGSGTHASGAFLARDLLVKRGSVIELDSHFVDRAPTADPQSVATFGADPIEITLTGSDPEDQSLTFSIVAGPSFGTLSSPIPIVPDPVTDPDTGETVQPPVTSAAVVYDPDSGDDVEDSFVFAVADPPGAIGTAVVTINPPPLDEPPPGPPETVVADDVADTTPRDTELLVTLAARAPEGVDLTFAILEGPGHGALGPLTPGGESPVRTATAQYTPDPGFVGDDWFLFEACGTISGVEECDAATFFVEVFAPPVEPEDLAEDQEVTGFAGVPTAIDLSGGAVAEAGSQALAPSRRAAFLDPVEVAGDVADADGDGLGDNSNDLPGTTPVFVSAGVDLTGGPGSNGVVRIHAEWNLDDVFVAPDELVGADVLLHTHRGTTDSLDTFFYAAGLPGEYGTLEDSDFESPLEPVPGAVMPVPVDSEVGDEGTFSFSVLGPFRAALESGADAFVVQGRVDESLAGAGPARGLEIRSSADSNVAEFLQPQLSITTPGVTPSVEYTLLSLPSHGTLFDSTGAAVVEAGTLLPGPNLTYQPAQGFVGLDQLTFEAKLATTVDVATVTVVVVLGSCLDDERFCDDGR